MLVYFGHAHSTDNTITVGTFAVQLQWSSSQLYAMDKLSMQAFLVSRTDPHQDHVLNRTSKDFATQP